MDVEELSEETPTPDGSSQTTVVMGKGSYQLRAAMWTLGAPLAGAATGLLLGAVLIAITGASPVSAYRTMIEGALGGPRQITETVLKATPLLIMGLGLMVAFRSRAWNIGGEGQYFIGALGGWLVGFLLQDHWPVSLVIPAMMLGGALGGALWAGLAALLKIRGGINEIITTLMLNYIALFLVSYLARGPLNDPASYLPQSSKLIGPARMPLMFDTRLHIGILVAAALVPLTYILIWKTPLGFRLRAIGSNQNVARYAGMNVAFGIAFALLFSGALAGLSGTIEISALHTRLKDGISGDYGFTGILVALLGRLNPFGVLVAAFFFAVLSIGAQSMHGVYGLPIALAQVIQALVVLLILGADALVRLWRR
jgi:simple sugar transport system permease protein